jgi:hypothetical protein
MSKGVIYRLKTEDYHYHLVYRKTGIVKPEKVLNSLIIILVQILFVDDNKDRKVWRYV